jgi:inositol hexakisphosphate/diphosphoinositol-pentakisphosphate kinase
MPSLPKPVVTEAEKQREKSWTLKSTICVARHGDRTPKCKRLRNLERSFPLRLYITNVLGNAVSGKLKFKFKGKEEWTSPFIALLQGRTTEIILRDPVQLQYVADAAEAAALLPGADLEQLEQLRKIIDKKKSTIGTKVQLKPSFTDGVCETLAIVVKWGGEVSWLAGHTERLFALLVVRSTDGWCRGSSLMLRATKHETSRKTCAKVKKTVSPDYARVKKRH